MSNVHSEQTTADGIHIAHAFTYANDAARLADVRGYPDVGKLALQTDVDQPSYWVLDAPPNWWRRIVISPYLDNGSAMDRGLIAYQFGADAVPGRIMGKKSRGTPAFPADMNAGDVIAEFVANGRLASAFSDRGYLRTLNFDASGNAKFSLGLHDSVALREITNTLVTRIATTNATPTTGLTVPMANNNSIVSYAARWRGIDAANNMVLKEQTGVYRRIAAAAPTIFGTPGDVFPIAKDDAAVGTPGIVVSGNDLLVQVTGKAATNYTWDLEFTWREMF
jgi:hypothetical protein